MRDDIFTIPVDELPFDPLDEEALLRHAREMSGRRIGDLAEEVGNVTAKGEVNKGDFGGTVEKWFRLKPNQRQEPDFPETPWSDGRGVGIELKTLPVKRLKSAEFRSKERTVLSMIDFEALAKEAWENASVRQKLERILFVTYWHDYDDKPSSTVQGAFLWTPPPEDYPQFEADWRATRDAVAEGAPERISESLGRYLGACTKGSKDPKHRQLPNGREAHPRAWALKAAYTWTHVSDALDTEAFVQAADVLAEEDPALTEDAGQLAARTGETRLDRVERLVLDRLQRLEGETIGDVCERLGLDVEGQDKNLAARLMSKVVGIREDQDLLELAAAGVRAKTMHFRTPGAASGRQTDMIAFESMSFPTVDLVRMGAEDWDEDDIEFRDQVQRLLIIPTFSEKRDDAQAERRIGRAFLWSPTPDQWRLIEQDWRRLQDLLLRGGVVYSQKTDAGGRPRFDSRGRPLRENDMPGNEPGHAVHMRPKAADSRDECMEPTGNMVTKQCLWLNGWFVRELLLASQGRNSAEQGIRG